jgi:tryptophan halogenase
MDTHDLFRIDSWAQVMVGQRVIPHGYHPSADIMDEKTLKKYLDDFRADVKRTVAQVPPHQDFVNQYCRAPADIWKDRPASTS